MDEHEKEMPVTIPRSMYDLMYSALIQVIKPEFFEAINNQLSHEQATVKKDSVVQPYKAEDADATHIANDLVKKAFEPLTSKDLLVMPKQSVMAAGLDLGANEGSSAVLEINGKMYDIAPLGTMVSEGMGSKAQLAEDHPADLPIPTPAMTFTNMPNPPPKVIQLVWPKHNLAYTLRCVGFGDKKIHTIKAVRDHFGWSLEDSKIWVENGDLAKPVAGAKDGLMKAAEILVAKVAEAYFVVMPVMPEIFIHNVTIEHVHGDPKHETETNLHGSFTPGPFPGAGETDEHESVSAEEHGPNPGDTGEPIDGTEHGSHSHTIKEKFLLSHKAEPQGGTFKPFGDSENF